MNMSLGRKIGSGFAVVILVLIVTSVVAVVQIDRLTAMEEAYSERANQSILIEEAAMMGFKLYTVVGDLVINENIAEFERNWKTITNECTSDFDYIESIVSNPADVQAITSVQEKYEDLVRVVEQELVPAVQLAEGVNDTIRTIDARVDSDVSMMNADLRAIAGSFSLASKEASEEYLRVAGSARTLGIILAVVGLLAGVIIGFLTTRSIVQPILYIAEGAKRLSTGDAKLADMDQNRIKAINDRTDELGDIGKEFSNLIGYFQHKSSVVGSFSRGELNVDINVASEQDEIAHALIELRGSLQGIATEVDDIADAAIKGRLDERGEANKFDGAFAELVTGINGTIDTLVGHLDKVPNPIMIIDNDYNIQYMNQAGAELLNKTQHGLIGQKCFNNFKTGDCQTANCACARTLKSGHVESSETVAKPNGKSYDIVYSGVAIKDRNGKTVGALEVITDQTEMKAAQRRDQVVAEYQNQEVENLKNVLDAMSQGDLTVYYEPAAAADEAQHTYQTFTEIAVGMNATLDNLNQILDQVRQASEQMTSGADQVSGSSQTLSQGATEQASSLEEISSAMTELDSQTSQNADNALQANTLAGTARDVAHTGNDQMQSMLSAMTDINTKSSEVQRIIKVIDEIAFQTNLLALNAAVEAARAGVHGKGFAVVAEEVRNLAQRSAKAARETTELIEGNMTSVKNGSDIAERTAASLAEIEEAITKATDLVNEIASASKEQTRAVGEVNSSLGQIDQVTQSNAANAEESAAASEELSSQSSSLLAMLQRFQLRNEGRQLMQGDRRGAGNGGQRRLPSDEEFSGQVDEMDADTDFDWEDDDDVPRIELDD